MALVKIRPSAQITLPPEIREAAHLEDGDYLEAELSASGVIQLRPVGRSGDPTPAQEAEILAAVDEARALNAIKRGR